MPSYIYDKEKKDWVSVDELRIRKIIEIYKKLDKIEKLLEKLLEKLGGI